MAHLRQAEGMKYVYVNGVKVVEGKDFESTPGTLLRSGRDTHGSPLR